MFDIKKYYEANTLDEALNYLWQEENPIIISGGTDVLVKARDRKENYTSMTLVGITRIPELSDIYLDEEENLVIGSANTFTTIENNDLVKKYAPLLSYAVSTVGGPQTRNVGTIGGNICNGATSADSAPTLFAYNATLEIKGKNGVRNIPITEFYKGPGKVELSNDEILVKIKIAKKDYEGYKGHYTKFAQREALDIANLSCAVLIKENNNIIKDIRICFGVAGPTPIRMKNAEIYAKEKEISEEVLSEIGKKCLLDAVTRDSWRASKEYRDHLVTILPVRNIRTALGGAK
ncbi:xanthine dehydrogenase subunit XdhB [Miniphocaeibacter massiliensis]|uniref:xanthine dehydrogenase subunit XdhB n=1 Tax=Miniphocaeibacter massiliensis TaxID=2041841 RepID=UPI000C07D948|nr:xanthine dehydrogenase subunit XdhB [Miniphocaeibacter massiliensis]